MVFPFMDPLMVLFCILILRSSCHTLCNWMASLQCNSPHESSPDVEKLPSHLLHFNGCFLQGSCDGTSSLLILNSSCHTICNWMAPLQCDSLHESSPDVEKLLWHLVYFNGCFQWNLRSDGTSSLFIMKISCHTICTWMASLQCDSLHLHWVAAQRSPLLSSSAVTITSLK